MQLCFFTDELASNFQPLTLTRPLDDLRIGILTIGEKWIHHLNPTNTARLSPAYLSDLFETDSLSEDDLTVWINSRYLPSPTLIDSILSLKPGDFLYEDSFLVAAMLDGVSSINLLQNNSAPSKPLNVKTVQSNLISIRYFWDMLALNASQIEADLTFFEVPTLEQSTSFASHTAINPENIYLAKTAIIEPGVILLAEDGPIFIDEGATIEAGAIIRGPVAICKNATVKMMAQIFGGTTIGPVCKAAGEINNVILHSYSNKAHDGFMGNSVIGQWCNFGAGTITSNLKNNYGKVKLPHWETGKLSEIGVQFCGTIMADHSKTAIGTTLNTGTVCGVSSNILNSGFPPKLIRSFSWVSDNGVMEYRFNHAIETMKAMMTRRKVPLTNEYHKMMLAIFNHKHR